MTPSYERRFWALVDKLEELPDLSFDVKLTVDATAANAVIRAGGEAAERLLPHRVAKNKLGVR